MPIANPLVQGGAGGGGFSPPAGAPNDAPPAYDPPPTRRSLSALGRGGFTSPDNQSAQVALMVTAALAFIVLLHVSGFRFAVDAGVTRS